MNVHDVYSWKKQEIEYPAVTIKLICLKTDWPIEKIHDILFLDSRQFIVQGFGNSKSQKIFSHFQALDVVKDDMIHLFLSSDSKQSSLGIMKYYWINLWIWTENKCFTKCNKISSFLILVIGILEGGHVSAYDVCKDELYLIMGRPEISQLFVNENVEQKGTEENENFPSTLHEGKSCFDKQLDETYSPWKSAFVKQSVQVTILHH